jgi:hypothetical protein
LGTLGKKLIAAVCSPAVWIPALVLFVLTAVFRCTDLDMAVVRPFFQGCTPGDQIPDRWPLMNAYPWKALYDFGIYPALLMGAGGLVVWVASFIWPGKLERWRDEGLFYGLLLIIGPGIIINGALKPYWGRRGPTPWFASAASASSCRCGSTAAGRTNRLSPAATPRWAFA